MDWLTYTNGGATRSLPLSPELIAAMGFLPELGLTMEVFSGGQPSAAEGGNRIGSPRHDHGNAADVFFYQDGRRLDWANAADLPIFEEIVRRARAAGITGFGAGEGYMQPGSMHIGFGAPAVWGAGGQGSNAPNWLLAAFDGATAGSVPAVSGSRPGSVAAPLNALAEAARPAIPQWRNSLSAEPFLMGRHQNALVPIGPGNPYLGY